MVYLTDIPMRMVYLFFCFLLLNCRVVFHEVIQTSKLYMRDITVVSAEYQLHSKLPEE